MELVLVIQTLASMILVLKCESKNPSNHKDDARVHDIRYCQYSPNETLQFKKLSFSSAKLDSNKKTMKKLVNKMLKPEWLATIKWKASDESGKIDSSPTISSIICGNFMYPLYQKPKLTDEIVEKDYFFSQKFCYSHLNLDWRNSIHKKRMLICCWNASVIHL